jgi:hypothetical protein
MDDGVTIEERESFEAIAAAIASGESILATARGADEPDWFGILPERAQRAIRRLEAAFLEQAAEVERLEALAVRLEQEVAEGRRVGREAAVAAIRALDGGLWLHRERSAVIVSLDLWALTALANAALAVARSDPDWPPCPICGGLYHGPALLPDACVSARAAGWRGDE